MKVTTVSASVRYSKAIGDGQHKTVELSAEAALDGNEAWTGAQASLYEELGQQLKALWGNGQRAAEAPTMNAEASYQPEPPPAPAHYCQEHQTEYKRFEKATAKGVQVWYSHKGPDGEWCKEK